MVNGNKLKTYRQYKFDLKPSAYVKNVRYRDQRQILSNFRSGCLKLEIELGRFAKPAVPLENRMCKYCNFNCVENEKHFLLYCPVYSDLRNLLFLRCVDHFKDFNTLSYDEKFYFLMENSNVQVIFAQFLTRMFKRRCAFNTQ